MIWLLQPDGGSMWVGAFFRVGLVMGAFWLAIPRGRRGGKGGRVEVSPKTLLFTLFALIGIGWRPRIAIPCLLLFLVLRFVIRPRRRHSK